jgi:hypothetical protein
VTRVFSGKGPLGATDGTHPRVKSRADVNRKESTKKETHIRKIQNDNFTFRVTTDLKKRLTEFCLENDLHNSAVLRQALAGYLKEHMTVELRDSRWNLHR